MPLFEFQSCRAYRRVLASGSIVSGFSFCNSLVVVKSNRIPKIAVKFARLDNLPNTSLTYENFHTFLSKFFHGSMSSKINPPVGKFSNRYSQQQQQQQQQQQHPGGGPVPLVGQLTDRASGEPGKEPTLQQQCPIVGRRAVLPPYGPDRQRQPSFDFFSGRGCAGGRSLFTRGERTSSSREGSRGGREFDGISCCSSGFSPIPDGGATPVVEAPPPLIPTFLSRTTRESPNAEGEPGHLAAAPSLHRRSRRSPGKRTDRKQLPNSCRTTVHPGVRLVSRPRPPPRRQFSQNRRTRHRRRRFKRFASS
jgi:hypothetical protein